MLSIRMALLSGIAAGSLFIGGCASVPMASPERDAQAKSFSALAGRSNIYIYRNESMGAAIKMPVVIDGRMAGDTAANTCLLASVEPGAHSIISKTKNDSSLQLNTVAGKNYFVWQEVKMGMWAARSQLHEVDEEKGKKAVSECKLIEGAN